MSHTPETNVQAFEWMVFKGSLRRAMDCGALLLHHQPQGDVRTGRFVDAEALQRWRRPEPGIVMPVRLIPMLEENGRIVRLGERSSSPPDLMLKCNRMPGSPLRVAVNLFAPRFNQETFAEKVDRVLEETGSTPSTSSSSARRA